MAPRSLARLALLALLWGSSFLWIKLALDGLSPVQLVLVRLALGAAVLFLVVRLRQLRMPRDRTTWLHLTFAALVANAIPYLLFAIGEQTVSSSLAGALNATTPLDAWGRPEDDQVVIVASWVYVGSGYATEGERWLALSAAARAREQRRIAREELTTTTRSAA